MMARLHMHYLVAAIVAFVAIGGLVTFAWRSDVQSCGVDRADSQNKPSAVLRMCAEIGFAPAQAHLGMLFWGASASGFRDFDNGMTEIEMNDEGRRLVEAAASHGQVVAQNELGLAYLEGHYGVEQNFALARHWLEAATENGDEIATFNLARMYYAGHGVPRSVVQAEALLRASAARGYKPGMCSLAELLERKGLAASRGEIAELRRVAAHGDVGLACTENDLMDELK